MDLILKWALQLIGYLIDKKITDVKQKKVARASFLEFLAKIEPTLGDSARLRTSAQNQIERLEKQLEEIDRQG